MNCFFRTIFIAGALALGAFVSSAQTDKPGLPYSVQGSVVDAHSGKSLPAVNVAVPGRQYATVSNADGDFVIKSDQPIKSLEFSCMGYKRLRLDVFGKDVVARMIPDKYLLDASSIVSGDPLKIVISAIRSIPDNYSNKPELLRCFYRETLQKRNRYISVSEAVTRLYRTPYNWSSHSDRTAIDKSRIIMSQRKRDTLSVKLMGGPTIPAINDVVKNREALFDDIEKNLYDFEMGAPQYIGDRLQFVITFRPREIVEYPLFYGTLYIDRERLSFTRIEMSMDLSDRIKAEKMLLMKKPRGLRFYPKEVTFIMTYRQDGAINRLAYFRSTLRFNCDWRKRLLSTSYAVINETVITDVVQPAVPITRQEMFKTTDFMSDKAAEFQDPEFWKDYNIIEPTESLEHAVGRLHKTY